MNVMTLGSQFGCKSLDFIIEEIQQDMDGTSITVRVPTITDIIKTNIYEGRDIKDYCDNDVRLTADLINSRPFIIKKVIFNDPATIILWEDGTKTVVKCSENDMYNPEMGMTMAICKKALGNKGSYCKVFKKWLPEEDSVDLRTAQKLVEEKAQCIHDIEYLAGMSLDDLRYCFAAGYSLVSPETKGSFQDCWRDIQNGAIKEEDGE